MVLGRGVIPAEIMFIGEAPGRSEDLIGEAFVGRAGRILNAAMADATETVGRSPTFYISNTVGCIPCDRKGGDLREPQSGEWLACWPRLQLTYRLVDPEEVIFLGSLARVACGDRFQGAHHLLHPAYILRRGGTSSMEYRTFVRELADIFAKKPPSRLGSKDVFGDAIRRG